MVKSTESDMTADGHEPTPAIDSFGKLGD